MPSKKALRNLQEALEYAERPLTPKELRAEYLEYNGEKFTSDFPKPAGGQSFTEFLIEIIEEAGLQIKYDDEECTFSFKKKRLPKIEKSSKVEESSKPRSSRSKKEVNESSESEREEEVKKPERKQRNSRNQKSESSDVNAAGSASMLKTAMSKANQDSKKVGEEGFPNNGSSFVGNALENSSKKREDDGTKNENNEKAAENDTESVKKEPETVKKPLPENLKTFYQNIGKAMQSIDTTSIDAISKKFGRKKSLKFAKYGYSSALELLVSIEGFYKPKGMANPNAIIYREGGAKFYEKTDTALDQNNNKLEKTSLNDPQNESKTTYYRETGVKTEIKNENPMETAYTQAITSMSQLLYKCGPDFYKQTLQSMVKFTDNTLLADSFKTVNFTSTHVDFMRKGYTREACLSKVQNFVMIEFLVKNALKERPGKSCRLDDLNEFYMQEIKKILTASNATTSPPTLSEIMKKAGLSSLKETVETFSDVVVVGDMVHLKVN